MHVGVGLLEIHIPHAQSLKEKRMVVKSLRDRIRNHFEVSAAEVSLQDLHQRARLGVSIVSSDAATIERVFDEIQKFAESTGDFTVLGWNDEIIPFEDDAALDLPHLDFQQDS